MLRDFFNGLKREANHTYTENGAVTYASTMNHCLDLFATAGALRNSNENEIISRFVKAYAENPDSAMRILFYARDIRGGLGERRFFRVVLKYMANNYPESVVKNMDWMAEMGRYDDFLVLMDTRCEKNAVMYLKKQLEKDIMNMKEGNENISLLAKWLPSVNTSNKETVALGKKLAAAFGMTEKQYRKNLSALRKVIDIIENHLRQMDYSFDYEKQPGKAMFKYRNAFMTHDNNRYMKFLNRVNSNEAKIHMDTLMPYEIIRPFYWRYRVIEPDNSMALETMWYAQQDYTGEQDSLVVVDGSGSMYGHGNPAPAMVAQSLGLYFAERNRGAFANHFITFSNTPKLVEVKGRTLHDKLDYISRFNEVADTNIQAVFELILDVAVKNRLSQKDMPERIFIISDMEFNACARNSDITNFNYAKKKFEAAGYKLPNIVFWNVASRNQNMPVKMNEQGVTLISGCNPKLFQQVLADCTNPYEFMNKIINSERYLRITA